jgi:hypothetical protein
MDANPLDCAHAVKDKDSSRESVDSYVYIPAAALYLTYNNWGAKRQERTLPFILLDFKVKTN